METILAQKLADPASLHSDGDKSKTNFAKDVPKMKRYSLADSADVPNSAMDYHIEIITKNDEHRVLKFLKRFFFRDEPLNHCTSLIPEGEDSTCVELEEFCCHQSMENNLSLMAVSSSGAIIGVILNGKMKPPSEEDERAIESCKNHKFRKILRLLHYVNTQVYGNINFDGANVLEIKILSVDSNWRGKGIAKGLIEKSMEIAREQNFQMARADCSSFFSAKLCEKLMFEAVYTLEYAAYVDETGNPIFKPDPPHTYVITYVKRL